MMGGGKEDDWSNVKKKGQKCERGAKFWTQRAKSVPNFGPREPKVWEGWQQMIEMIVFQWHSFVGQNKKCSREPKVWEGCQILKPREPKMWEGLQISFFQSKICNPFTILDPESQKCDRGGQFWTNVGLWVQKCDRGGKFWTQRAKSVMGGGYPLANFRCFFVPLCVGGG